MPAEHYELSGSSMDSLKDAAQASPSFDVNFPSDYSNYGAWNSTAKPFLPEITIDDVRSTVADLLSQERAADVVYSKGQMDESSKKYKDIEKRGETVFSKNEDGTYMHVVEKGDTYWDVARTVVMAQTGIENRDDVKNADIQKMMNKLLEYNGRPTSGDGANRLSVGEEIYIPKDVSDLVEKHQDEEASGDEPGETVRKKGEVLTEKVPTAKEQKELSITSNGAVAESTRLNPHDGVYSPLQPPGLEPGQTGAYDTQGHWNYDVEDRQVVSDVTNAKTGMRTVTYTGEIDSGYGANGLWWNDTPYDATEMVNANGIITHRSVNYQDSSVKMNFDNGAGHQVDAYVTSVQSDLDPSTGNYKTVITTADGQDYYLQVDGKTGRVIRDSN